MEKIVPQIKFKSVLQPIKNIEKRNEYFNSLTDEGKRLEIAWDCLQLICIGKIREQSFLGFWSKNLKTIETKTSKEFQQLLVKKLPTCEVCARGGIMLSQIRLGNELPCYSKDSDVEEGRSDILKGFSMDDMYRMEEEYEYSLNAHPFEVDTVEKLANIMCNILVNGNFNTEDKTDYLTPKK